MYLSEELVILILLRSPAKSLMRFKSVRKSWCAIISDTSFITKSNLFNNPNNNTLPHLLVKRRDRVSNNQVYSFLSNETLQVMPSPTQLLPMNTQIEKEREPVIRILGSCNGIFCLYEPIGRIILWNPANQETKVLPQSHTGHPWTLYYNCFIGFGYDDKINDFKVLRICACDYDEFWELGGTRAEEIHVEIYNLSTDSWRALKGGDFISYLLLPYTTVDTSSLYADTNGMCSWWADNRFTGCAIVSFDMRTEVFFYTPVPDAFSDLFSFSSDTFSTTGVELLMLCGSTAMAVYDKKRQLPEYFDIWVLLQYGVKESWTKLLSIGPLTGVKHPLGFWKNGGLFMETSEGQLVLYDPVTQELKNLQVDGAARSLSVATYKETQVAIN